MEIITYRDTKTAIYIEEVLTRYSENCDNLGKSESGGKEITLMFNNQTNSKIESFWVDFDGKPKSYEIYSPGERREQRTYVKHPWFFIYANTKKCVGTYIPHSSHDKKQLSIME